MDNFQQIDPKYLALIQAGMGILANNDGRRSASSAIGQGLLGGVNSYQENLQNQQMMQMRNDQIQSQRQLFDARAGEIKAEGEDRTRKNAAIEQWKIDNPNFAQLANIDFGTAYKAFNPKAATDAQPFFQDRYIGGKVYAFDTRTGEYIEKDLGGSNLPNKDDPRVRFPVSAADSAGKNMYEVTDKKDGFLLPMTNLAIESGAPALDFLTPSAPTPPAMSQIPPNVPRLGDNKLPYNIIADPSSSPEELKQLQEVAARDFAQNGNVMPSQPAPSNNVAPPAQPNVGIKVPTKAEQAGNVTKAQETAKSDAALETDKTKNIKTANKFLSVAKQAESLLDKDPTGSGLGAMIDKAGRLVGASSESSQVASQLEAVSGWLVSNVPRMEGPQSNFDVENYKTMAGMVGDRTIPVSDRKEALKEVIRLQEQYKSLNGEEATKPTTVTPPKGAIDALRLSPKLKADFDAKYGAGASDKYLGK